MAAEVTVVFRCERRPIEEHVTRLLEEHFDADVIEYEEEEV